MFSNNAVDDYIKKPVKPARRSLKMNLTGSKEDENQKKKFQMCQKNHDLDACLKYKQLQVNDSKNFLMKSKLCFGCHDVISKELSGKNCQKKKKVQHLQEQLPLSYTVYSQKNGHMEKKMIAILLQCHQEMRKRKVVVCVHARACVCVIFFHREVFFQL